LKKFSNFETGYDGPKRKRFAYLGIGFPAGAEKGHTAAPCGAMSGGCVEAPLLGLSASFRCQRVQTEFFLAANVIFLLLQIGTRPNHQCSDCARQDALGPRGALL
jgi:hypothetical protein